MMGIKIAIGSFYHNLISNIIPIVLYIAAGVSLIVLIMGMIKIEDAGEKEEIKEEVSEF